MTLLGPPGAGKTRLALELARGAPPPVWYVSLEQIPDVPVRRRMRCSTRLPRRPGRSSAGRRCHRRAWRPARPGRPRWRARSACPRLPTSSRPCSRPAPDIRILTTSRERLGAPRRGDRAGRAAGRPTRPSTSSSTGPGSRIRTSGSARTTSPWPTTCARSSTGCRSGLELVARHLQLLRLDEVVKRVESDIGRWAGGPIGGRAGPVGGPRRQRRTAAAGRTPGAAGPGGRWWPTPTWP